MKHSPFRAAALLLAFPVAVSAQVQITEFMASNSNTLADENGSYQDWIEIENTTASPVNLFNWSLTDAAGNPNKWRFPAKTLAPRERLVVFASGKDRVNPSSNLHTNFSLSADGEYLALVRPDGSVASEFSPGYPPQVQNLSYGFPVQAATATLVTGGSALRYTVPSDGALGTGWTAAGFDDTAWTAGTNGIGYDTGATDLQEELNYPDAMTAAAPLGYWRFSETSGTVAANSGTLGASADAAYAGGALLNQAGPRPNLFNGFDAANAAAGFSGTTQQVIVPDAAGFDFGTGPFAIEMWFYPANAATRGDLFTYKGAGGDFGIHLASQTAGKISVYHNAFIGAAGGTVVNNAWHHLVVTRNAGGTLTAYLNGYAILSGTDANSMNISSALVFGSNHTGTPTSPAIVFNGRIDEAALFNREVTAAEALSRFQRAVGPGGNYADAMAAASPLGHWRASETSGSTAANAGTLGAAANAAYAGGTLLNQEGPRPAAFGGFEPTNTAVGFSGTTQQVIVPDHAAFDMGTGAFAIEMWFYPASASVRADLFTYKGAGGDFGIHLASQAPGKISVYHNGFIGAAGGTVTDSTWHHLVVTRNASSTLTAYLNGAPVVSGTDAATMNIANAPVFGSNHTGTPTSPSYVLSGRLDEMAIYNREITAAEALSRYQRATTTATTFAAHFSTDLQAAMHGVNNSVYVRIPFTVADAAAVSRLALKMKYDDGFAAYVNGHAVLDVNAPVPTVWNSAATARRPDSAAVQDQEFEFDDAIQWLQSGTNVLAIHALNITAANYDLLCRAELTSTSITASGATAAYLAGPTPGAANIGGTGTPGPVITLAAHTPAQPADAEDILVTARVRAAFSPVTAVNLNYRVMFGSTVQIPMLDDGAHGDGAAGDGVFGAAIPATASAPGEMVRWFLTASDTTSPGSRWPLFADPLNSPEYLGTVVKSVTSNLPVWEWFAQNPANGRNAAGTRAAVFFNGEFYDNVFVRSRGGYTSTGSQKFDFNPGAKCFINDEVGRVEEANLNAPGSDASYIRPPLAFETYRLTGHPACVAFNTVLRVNGAADRVGYYVEQVDDDFLERNGLDEEGALYKFIQRGSTAPVFSDAGDGIEKKTRKTEAWTDLQEFVAGLNQADVNARRAWFWDNVNVPSLWNLLAVSRITQDADDVRKNFYLYRDTNGNREWSLFPWDKDWTFGVTGDGPPHLYHPFFGDAAHAKQPGTASPQWNRLWEFVFNDATLQPLVMRRLRTVMDAMLQPPGTVNGLFEQRATAWMTALSPNVPSTVSSQLAGVLNFFPGRRNDLFTTYSVAGGSAGNQLIPNAQPAAFSVAIAAVEFNPASGNQDQEYIQLVNPGGFAADISGWKLAGAVTMTFDPGTVIPAGGSLYASPDSAAFRSRTTGPRGGQQLQVQDRYNGQLSARGETIQLLDATGDLVAENSYTGAPTAAQQQLRITELNFAPAPPTEAEFISLPAVSPSDFEFIELQNIGATALDLNGCRFEKGVTFAFAGFVPLPPGGRILLVSNAAAFALRYPGTTPDGQFSGNLDNSGETLQLVDSAGEVILDFRYDPSWFPPADSAGRSLVVRQASPDHSSYDSPTHWALSGSEGGSPTAADADFAHVYEGWRWDHFGAGEIFLPSPPNPPGTVNAALAAPEANPDNDLLANLGEYAFGSDPLIPNGNAILSTGSITIGPDTFATVTFRRRHKALDLAYAVEFSGDLAGWTITAEQIGAATDLGGGMEEVTFRDALAAGGTRRFVRVRAEKQ